MDVIKFVNACKAMGLGPSEVARQAGMSRRGLWLILNRGTSPRLPTLAKLAAVVGMRASDLILP